LNDAIINIGEERKMSDAVQERPMPTGEGLTFEKVWAMFQETERRLQEEAAVRAREAEARAKEAAVRAKEADERMIKLERLSARNSKQIGGLHRRFCQLAEHLVAPGIWKRFNELGHHFQFVSSKGWEIKDETGRTLAQIDLVLENSDLIIAIEVKSTPSVNDVAHHAKRIEIMRNALKKTNDGRKIQAAIAGAIYIDQVKKAVWEAGFYVIEQSGDTMKIVMPEGWQPKVF
jgi:hypothetical protein